MAPLGKRDDVIEGLGEDVVENDRPPPRPEEISPSPRRADIACRTGPRELSNFLVSSASEGSSSPGWNEPSRIAVRR
ncbi:hypothetical protein [Brevibacterium siliguriense]|uniref:hypothetical protein n=1 Tax=Brevibacterium siliguriense TaxID=1136497 RepID=UPI0018D2C938|nr:hypothetical protein [Brevibacterium siliguriense]